MNAGIEDLDGLAFDFEAIWNVNHILEDGPDALRNRRLAIPGWTIDQDRSPGIERGSDLLDETFGNFQALKGALDGCAINLLARDALVVNALPVRVERDGSRPDILVLTDGVERPLLALFCESVAQLGRHANAGGSQRAQQFSLLGLFENQLDDPVRQFDDIDDCGRRFGTRRIHGLDCQIQQIGQSQSSFGNRTRRPRSSAQHRLEIRARQSAVCYQNLAETTALRPLMVKCRSYIGRRHQLVRHKKIADERGIRRSVKEWQPSQAGINNYPIGVVTSKRHEGVDGSLARDNEKAGVFVFHYLASPDERVGVRSALHRRQTDHPPGRIGVCEVVSNHRVVPRTPRPFLLGE
jgi:hypothetical protein